MRLSLNLIFLFGALMASSINATSAEDMAHALLRSGLDAVSIRQHQNQDEAARTIKLNELILEVRNVYRQAITDGLVVRPVSTDDFRSNLRGAHSTVRRSPVVRNLINIVSLLNDHLFDQAILSITGTPTLTNSVGYADVLLKRFLSQRDIFGYMRKDTATLTSCFGQLVQYAAAVYNMASAERNDPNPVDIGMYNDPEDGEAIRTKMLQNSIHMPRKVGRVMFITSFLVVLEFEAALHVVISPENTKLALFITLPPD